MKGSFVPMVALLAFAAGCAHVPKNYLSRHVLPVTADGELGEFAFEDPKLPDQGRPPRGDTAEGHIRLRIDAGIADADAAVFAGGFYQCVSADSAEQTSGEGLAHLIAEQTPGGLNEEAIRRHSEAGCYDGGLLYTSDAAEERLGVDIGCCA